MRPNKNELGRKVCVCDACWVVKHFPLRNDRTGVWQQQQQRHDLLFTSLHPRLQMDSSTSTRIYLEFFYGAAVYFRRIPISALLMRSSIEWQKRTPQTMRLLYISFCFSISSPTKKGRKIGCGLNLTKQLLSYLSFFLHFFSFPYFSLAFFSFSLDCVCIRKRIGVC